MTWKLSGFAIGETCYNIIKSIVPKGGTILELGSGEGTALMAKDYNVYSIEHNPDYVGKYNNRENYIHASLRGNWYDPKSVRNGIKDIKYDLLLVDGPDNKLGRAIFLKHYKLFDKNVPVIVDDVNKPHNLAVAYGIGAIRKRHVEIINDSFKKQIAVIV